MSIAQSLKHAIVSGFSVAWDVYKGLRAIAPGAPLEELTVTHVLNFRA